MDTSEQLYEADTTGWRRGLYDDIKHVFRAPFVNWVFRTATANYPELTRHLWGRVKPAFETRAFAETAVAYRDVVLSTIEAEVDVDVPAYRTEHSSVSPAEWRELRGQVATFDVVAPRLAVLFELLDRELNGGDVGTDVPDSPASTAPLPSWVDADRGREPSMAAFADLPEAVSSTVDAVQAFHGFEDGLPSVYRCLAQWPAFFEALWSDLEPVFESQAFDDATQAADEVAGDYVESIAYSPGLSQEELVSTGFDAEDVAGMAELSHSFNHGATDTVLTALPVFATTVGVGGKRSL